ncbi:MAG: hypothetical protein IPP71_01965 [Bacteroidetes bacterium]|nr:hypothetical protein [Bacteroidota bacterium]
MAGGGIYNQTGVNALFAINGNWLMGTGSTFNATAGTVQFSSDGNQSDFVNGTRQFFNILVDNNVNPGFSNTGPSAIPIKGDFTNNNNALVNSVNSTFIFNGTGNQIITTAVTNNNSTFGNFEISKPTGILSLQSNLNVSGNISLLIGTFDLNSFRCNRSTFGGTFLVSANTFLY